jgi:predicted nucleic acid-binding protein
VIVPDLNLLLYAEIDAYPTHAAARQWWETLLGGERQVGLAPVCVFGFLRATSSWPLGC